MVLSTIGEEVQSLSITHGAVKLQNTKAVRWLCLLGHIDCREVIKFKLLPNFTIALGNFKLT